PGQLLVDAREGILSCPEVFVGQDKVLIGRGQVEQLVSNLRVGQLTNRAPQCVSSPCSGNACPLDDEGQSRLSLSKRESLSCEEFRQTRRTFDRVLDRDTVLLLQNDRPIQHLHIQARRGDLTLLSIQRIV